MKGWKKSRVATMHSKFIKTPKFRWQPWKSMGFIIHPLLIGVVKEDLRSLAPVVNHLACRGGPMVAEATPGGRTPVCTAIPSLYRRFWSRESPARTSSLTGLILPGTGVNATLGINQTSWTMRFPIGPDQASGPLVGPSNSSYVKKWIS